MSSSKDYTSPTSQYSSSTSYSTWPQLLAIFTSSYSPYHLHLLIIALSGLYDQSTTYMQTTMSLPIVASLISLTYPRFPSPHDHLVSHVGLRLFALLGHNLLQPTSDNLHGHK